MLRYLLVAALVLASWSSPAFAAVTVQAFSPQGTVKSVRQVAARFSKPVVRFGDPRLADPFSIDCPAKGRARWADASNWVYDFEEDLPGGVQCRFTLKADFKTVSGEAFGGKKTFSFNTGGPAIRASLPSEGAEDIDENQAFLLALDAPVNEDTVRAHAWCAVDGVEEKIPLQVIGGEERKKLLAQREQLGEQYFRILWKNGRQSIAQVKDRRPEAAEALVLAAKCGRALPPQTQVQLVWGAGIATPGGAATTEDQTLGFKTRAEFSASFSCQRVNAKSACLPMTPMSLSFTAPVTRELAAKIVLKGEGHTFKAKLADNENTVQDLSFDGPFPEKGSFKIELPAGLTDDSGRSLTNAARFPLQVQTSEAPPLAKFGADFGILELSEGGVLPLTLRNVEAEVAAAKTDIPPGGIPGKTQKIDDDAQIAAWMRKVEKANQPGGEWDEQTKKWIEHTGEASLFDAGDKVQSFSVPKPHGAEAFEVVGIPLQKPGFYVVELNSPKLGAALLGDNRTRYVSASALVTNMAVHLQWGAEASQVFVSTLDTASPVANAEIRVSDSCSGDPLWTGRTDSSGIARIEDGKLPAPRQWGSCDGDEHPLMVSARANGDLGFTLSTWNHGITPGDFQLGAGSEDSGTTLAQTVLDRALFRAGETVSMKHFLREHHSAGLGLPQQYPDKLTLHHAGSDQTYSFPLQWDAHGSATTTWEIPKDARLGTYDITLDYDGGQHGGLNSGSFRVEQYKVPSMHAIVQGPKEPLVGAAEAPVDLFVSYLSGGGAAYLPVKLRAQVTPKVIEFTGYDGFTFGGDEVKPGIENGGGHGAFYDEDEGQENDEAGPAPGGPAQLIPLALDGQGAARAVVPKLPKSGSAQDLQLELDYQDANGETLSAAARVALWPAAVVLGVQPDGWVVTKDDLRFKVLALDLHGKPLANQSVTVDGYTRTTHSYRRRLVGGFYSYDNSVETKRIGELCSGRTDEHGLLFCKTKSDESGEIVVQAVSSDAKGNRALASTTMYVANGDDWWFEAGPSDRMDVLPEQQSYEAGQTARFQVRMPFREATALVTVEREGVIDSFVTHLSGKDPVVEVPVKDAYSPNIYVSVLALRGRVGLWHSRLADLVRWLHLPFHLEGGSPTALVDLSKPAYRLGIGKINVGWAPHKLEVSVTPSAETFKVRDTARVSIAVKAARGTLPAGAEVAIAAVDEGLLQLMPNESWKLLEAMMQPRGLDVTTSTAQMQVIGKRHYGRKAGAPGGGGGRAPARELFDTLLLWKARVPLDANGKAQVDIPLNDSLTSFKIVAIASAGEQQFGTGSASIRTTQELQLVSGLPGLVREGDHLNATVMLRNASNRHIAAEVSADVVYADGSGGNDKSVSMPAQTVQIDAGSAQEITWPLDVPPGPRTLSWDVKAQESNGKAADHLKLNLPVIAAYPVRTYQATLTQVDGSFSLPVERPKDAIPGRGGVHLDLRAHLGDGLDGVVEYMSWYPYICLEQRASQAIALGDEAAWARVMNMLPGYLDRDGLLKYFPSQWLDGSDTLTAYILAIAQEAGWEIPDDSRDKMLDGLKGFVAGTVQRDSSLKTADLSIRKMAAIAALARYGKAEPAMLSSISIQPNLWPTSAVLDWIDVLQRLPAVPKHDQRLTEALQILRSRLNFQGTIMSFSAEKDDALWWLMISADVNAVRAVLQVLPQADWREDVPRMVRGALGRQLRGHWNTTVANAWGVLAMKKFGAAFEAEPVAGSTTATLAAQTQSFDWSHPLAALDFAWPDQPGTLQLQHSGSGKPWALIQSRAALPLQQPLFTGYTVKRSVTPMEQKKDGVWTRGDVARVHLDLEAQSDMTWVVVDDPVPAGASIQGTGLGGSSALLTQGEKRTGDAWPAYEERRFDGYRAYYEFVPKGKWSVEYTVRFNASGRFELPATRIEAMYAPEMFGELPNAPMEVQAP